MSNIQQQFIWADEWTNKPSKNVPMTQNAYECILYTLTECLELNQSKVKRMMGDNISKVELLEYEIERGIRIKLTLQEIKRKGQVGG